MKLADFDGAAVAQAVRRLPGAFYTNDVALHGTMQAAHRISEGDDDWHSYLQMTGRYLHRHEAELDLILMPDRKAHRGRRWVKRHIETDGTRA